MTTQLHPDAGGAYGSSPLANGPHTDGTYDTQQSADYQWSVVMTEGIGQSRVAQTYFTLDEIQRTR